MLSQPIRLAAIAIVLAEEAARGWTAHELPSVAAEKQHGCDLLSTPPEGGPPHPIEVKGWGEPLRGTRGRFRYPQDLRASQMATARTNPNFRIEIVANLTAHLTHNEQYERLTLTAAEIIDRAQPRIYEVPLDGKEQEIVRANAAPSRVS